MPVTKDLAVTKKVSRYITDTDFETLPSEAIDRAKTCLLDAIGVGIAGTLSKAGRLAIDYGLSAFKEGPASLYGSFHSLNLEGAAWTNAVLVSALDMDDGHREPVGRGRSDNVSGHAAGHPATVVIPAAVGAAQIARASGQELLTAIVVAYEVSIRLAAARNPAIVLSNATGNWGAFAAASVPLLLIHGQADTRLPVSCSERIYAWAQEPKTLIPLPKGGHGLLECKEEVHRLLKDWLIDKL